MLFYRMAKNWTIVFMLLLIVSACKHKNVFLFKNIASHVSVADGENLRITWYLSSQLSNAKNLKIADFYLAEFAREYRRLGGPIRTLVRPPYTGERRPEFSLPIPAVDDRDRSIFLWSSLVLDQGNRRIVIPDLWDPKWLALDLARGFIDLQGNGPLALMWVDGTGSRPGIPVAAFQGRWDVYEWDFGSASPVRARAVIITDGPELNDRIYQLAEQIRIWMEAGIPVLYVHNPGKNRIDELRKLIAENSSLDGKMLSVFDAGEVSFRDFDMVLLELVGRKDLLFSLMAMPEMFVDVMDSPGRGGAGKRFGRPAFAAKGIRLGRMDQIESMQFLQENTAGIQDGFSLERNNRGGWSLSGEQWHLPARSDRVSGFIERLYASAAESWEMASKAGTSSENLTLVLKSSRQKDKTIEIVGMRSSGGGIKGIYEGKVILLSRLLQDEMAGDARYWMERRLYPDSAQPLRMELTTDKRLYWRLHEENGLWKFTDSSGLVQNLTKQMAEDFAFRLWAIESITIAPANSLVYSPFILAVEHSNGHRVEYRLKDDAEGRLIAESGTGIFHILGKEDFQFILDGPIPENS